jgi:methionine sulfoxide reductase heme-binding subunit
MAFNLASFLDRNEVAFGRLLLVLGLCPAAWIAWDWYAGTLGTNPLERLEKETGRWAFSYLLITLSVTPLRRLATWVSRRAGARYGKRLSDWNTLVRVRRQLGLTCFFYACLHLASYGWFDAGLEMSAFAQDASEKRFILAGLAAFLLLVPLAVTSTRAAMRRLGGNWRRLHRLVYVIAVLAACHFVWLAKPGLWPPYAYAAGVAVLLGYRLLAKLGIVFGRPRDDGMEATPRPSTWGDAHHAGAHPPPKLPPQWGAQQPRDLPYRHGRPHGHGGGQSVPPGEPTP